MYLHTSTMLNNLMSNKKVKQQNFSSSNCPLQHATCNATAMCEGRIGNKGVATSFVTNTEPALKDAEVRDDLGLVGW